MVEGAEVRRKGKRGNKIKEMLREKLTNRITMLNRSKIIDR